MATANITRGAMRLCAVAAVLWVIGMGWYQYNEAQKVADSGITLQLPNNAQLHIDANGIQQTEKSQIQMQRFCWVFMPALLILLLVPVGSWLARGFKPEGK